MHPNLQSGRSGLRAVMIVGLSLLFAVMHTSVVRTAGESAQTAEPGGGPVSEVAGDQAEWPMQIAIDDATIVLYQPQVTKFVGNALSARAAVSVTRAGGEPLFGAPAHAAQSTAGAAARSP